jgi:hypothetical protein
VSVSAKYFAKRLSYVSRAEQTLCGHKFKDDREWKHLWHDGWSDKSRIDVNREHKSSFRNRINVFAVAETTCKCGGTAVQWSQLFLLESKYSTCCVVNCKPIFWPFIVARWTNYVASTMTMHFWYQWWFELSDRFDVNGTENYINPYAWVHKIKKLNPFIWDFFFGSVAVNWLCSLKPIAGNAVVQMMLACRRYDNGRRRRSVPTSTHVYICCCVQLAVPGDIWDFDVCDWLNSADVYFGFGTLRATTSTWRVKLCR